MPADGLFLSTETSHGTAAAFIISAGSEFPVVTAALQQVVVRQSRKHCLVAGSCAPHGLSPGIRRSTKPTFDAVADRLQRMRLASESAAVARRLTRRVAWKACHRKAVVPCGWPSVHADAPGPAEVLRYRASCLADGGIKRRFSAVSARSGMSANTESQGLVALRSHYILLLAISNESVELVPPAGSIAAE